MNLSQGIYQHNVSILYNHSVDNILAVNENKELYEIQWYNFLSRFFNWCSDPRGKKVDEVAIKTLKQVLHEVNIHKIEVQTQPICQDTNHLPVVYSEYAMLVIGKYKIVKSCEWGRLVVRLEREKYEQIAKEMEQLSEMRRVVRKIHVLCEMIKVGGTENYRQAIQTIYHDSKVADLFINFADEPN